MIIVNARTITILVLLLFLVSSVFSQQITRGKQFWLTFMENLPEPMNDRSTFILTFHSEVATGVKITVPAIGFIQDIVLNAGLPYKHVLPDVPWYIGGSEVKGSKGILIEADQPISVTAFHSRMYFSEATRVVPVAGLGTSYQVITHVDDYPAERSSPCEFVILSTSDNNAIEIVPSVVTDGLRPAKVPYNIKLNKGETYQVQAKGDLSGTQIRSLSNEKIAVFAGARQAMIKTTGCTGNRADNHLYEQMIPVSLWSKRYVAMPFYGQSIAKIKVVKADINKSLTVGGVLMTGNSNVYEMYINKPTLITSDGNISVAAFVVSGDCSSGKKGDPSMVLVPGLDRFTNSETSFGLDAGADGINTFSEHKVNVVTRTNAIAAFKVNGISYPGSFFRFNEDTSLSTGLIPLANGFHKLSSDSGFSAVLYGLGTFDSYSYSFWDMYHIPSPPEPVGSYSQPFDVIAYPNPTAGAKLKIGFSFSDSLAFTSTIKMYDILGKLVVEDQVAVDLQNKLIEVDTYQLADAVYTLTVSTHTKTFMFKVLVNNKNR